MENQIEEGDILMCTVDRIMGTTVFVKIDGTNMEGSIVTSEIAPGRIRNLRDYVVPKKSIVCKVLRVSGDRIELSLRRVAQKEQKEARELHQQEKSCKSILKTVLGEKSGKIIPEMCKKEDLIEFLEEAKENPKILEKYLTKEESKRISEILSKQKEKIATIKKEFRLSSTLPEGIEKIKEVLQKIKGVEIKYISAGKYFIRAEAKDIKSADQIIKENLKEIEQEAKSKGMQFSVKEK